MIGFIDGDVLLHASMWNTKTIEEAQANAKRNIENWTDRAFTDEYYIALGSPTGWNYRDEIFLDYKQTTERSKSRVKRPDHFYPMKEWLAELSITAQADDIEADDLLGHWLTQSPEGVIITVDKDLNQVPGCHFNPRGDHDSGRLYTVTKEEADRSLLRQLVKGDPMDKIPGLPGKGNKAADNLDKSFDSVKDFATAVIELYREIHKESWEHEFLANGKLLWIQRHPKDWFSMKRYSDYFGV